MGLSRTLVVTAAAVLLLMTVPHPLSAAGDPAVRFRDAAEAVRAGDYPKATAIYRELAAAGAESASLYWNWAQAAAARGATGEALWALLRGREVEPSDAATVREVERLREAANLDAAELSPEPVAALARLSRRFHLGLAALVVLAASIAIRLGDQLAAGTRRATSIAWAALALGVSLSAVAFVGTFARPTGVVLRRNAPLLESASPTAESVGSLREGEVVPILSESGDYLRVEDSSGARGWASAADVPRLDRPPRAAP
jgi:Bacterial SH3 domain